MIRTIRAELNIAPSYRLTVLLRPSDAPIAAPRNWCRNPTCSTRGSRPPCGPSAPWAGRTRPRILPRSTPRPCSSPGSTSCSSGWPRNPGTSRPHHRRRRARPKASARCPKGTGNVIDPLVMMDGADALARPEKTGLRSTRARHPPQPEARQRGLPPLRQRNVERERARVAELTDAPPWNSPPCRGSIPMSCSTAF